MAKVVFIMTDTQRYDMVNANVSTGLSTPGLDALAASGMRFERAYTTQPVCQPARAGLFTGLYPHSCNGWTNSVALSADVKTIGQRLSDNGIHTAYIGKWHLDGGDYFGLGKCPDGWDADYWYDMRNYLEELTEEERVLSRDENSMLKRDYPAEFTYGHRCSDRAIDFIQKHKDEDYFLTVSYDEPHGPFICPREFWEMYKDYEFPLAPNVKDVLEDKPSYQKAWAGDRISVDRDKVSVKNPFYFGCNSFVDSEIDRVVKAIKATGEDIYIIYTSDHGDALESHCITNKGPCVYDEVARIPLFISGGDIPSGGVTAAPTSHIDLAPTVFEMLGVAVPGMFPGDSVLNLCKGEEQDKKRHSFIEFGRYEVDHDGFGGFQPLRAVFDGRYKLSINLLSTDEFYDLENDPYEMNNLIENPQCYSKMVQLHDLILENMNTTRDPFRGYYWERRHWRREEDCRKESWSYTGYTRQSENDYEARQLDYDTGLEMVEATRFKMLGSITK